MTKITKDDVLRVAQLAHLELGEAEVESLTRQLDSILSYVAKLEQLDTEGVEPMSQVVPAHAPGVVEGAIEDDIEATAVRLAALGTPLREDVHVRSIVIDEVLAGAPDPEPPYFRVPKVIELPKAPSGFVENDR